VVADVATMRRLPRIGSLRNAASKQAPRGVIPAQRYLVRPGGLATIDTRYYSDQPTSAGWAHPYGAFRAQLNDFLSGPDIPVSTPSTVTDYVTGSPSIILSNYIFRTWVSRADNSGFEDDALHELHAGERVTENWNAYPLHPAVNVNLLGKAGLPPEIFPCSAPSRLQTDHVGALR
jgi:hypothetical protein